jgi:hypothetical protein
MPAQAGIQSWVPAFAEPSGQSKWLSCHLSQRRR